MNFNNNLQDERIRKIDEIRNIANYIMIKFTISDYNYASKLSEKCLEIGHNFKTIKSGNYDEVILYSKLLIDNENKLINNNDIETIELDKKLILINND